MGHDAAIRRTSAERANPETGARMVAKAWTDPTFLELMRRARAGRCDPVLLVAEQVAPAPGERSLVQRALPVVATVLGVVVLGETLAVVEVIGVLVILPVVIGMSLLIADHFRHGSALPASEREPVDLGALARDEAQVRSICEALAERDANGKLGGMFAGEAKLTDAQKDRVTAEEGWILGI